MNKTAASEAAERVAEGGRGDGGVEVDSGTGSAKPGATGDDGVSNNGTKGGHWEDVVATVSMVVCSTKRVSLYRHKI